MRANSGLYKDFVVLRTAAGNTTYYYTYVGSPVPNPAFRNADLGVFNSTALVALVLEVAKSNSYEDNGAVMMAARLFYRVYPEGTAPGAFSPSNWTTVAPASMATPPTKKLERPDAGLNRASGQG